MFTQNRSYGVNGQGVRARVGSGARGIWAHSTLVVTGRWDSRDVGGQEMDEVWDATPGVDAGGGHQDAEDEARQDSHEDRADRHRPAVVTLT